MIVLCNACGATLFDGAGEEETINRAVCIPCLRGFEKRTLGVIDNLRAELSYAMKAFGALMEIAADAKGYLADEDIDPDGAMAERARFVLEVLRARGVTFVPPPPDEARTDRIVEAFSRLRGAGPTKMYPGREEGVDLGPPQVIIIKKETT